MAFSSGKPSLAEQIQKALGHYRFLYYKYLDFFKHSPLDVDDLIDGLIYIHLTTQQES